MDREYSDEIFKAVQNFLVLNDFNFETDEERGAIRFRLGISSKLKYLRYSILIGSCFYIVYAVSPIDSDSDDENVMKEMADFICRANYGLRSGNFELDMNDGEIRYKTFVDCDGVMPSEQVIRGSLGVPSLMFNRYAPGMLDIIFRDSTAKDAIAKCERE